MNADTPTPVHPTLTDEERDALHHAGDIHGPDTRDCSAYVFERGFQDDDCCAGLLDTIDAVEGILAAREQALREEIAQQAEVIARAKDLLEVLDNSDDGGRIVWASGLEVPVSDLRDGLRRALAVTEEWGETR